MVFVVDDDPDTRELLVALLESRAFRAVAYERAEHALAAALARAPDLVLTDLSLGSLSGAELARSLRSCPETADIALVAITGVEEPQWETQRHFDAYLRKPLDPESLPELIGSLIDAVARARAQRAG